MESINPLHELSAENNPGNVTKSLPLFALLLFISGPALGQDFDIEEVTIKELHSAIQDGHTTCQQVVQSYIERIQAYNGACTALITQDGAAIPQTYGNVRAGSRVQFPTQTVAVDKILPNLDLRR